MWNRKMNMSTFFNYFKVWSKSPSDERVIDGEKEEELNMDGDRKKIKNGGRERKRENKKGE